MALVTLSSQSTLPTETSKDRASVFSIPAANVSKVNANYVLHVRERYVALSDTHYDGQAAAGTEAENQSLDMTHEAFKFYFKGRLSLAPLEDLICPTAILDIGAGSCAWAAQAAQTFPEAKVIAVDRTPPPAREFPRNLYFKRLDLSVDFLPELEEAAFDIIHAQLIFIHLPNPDETLQRIARLLKPGGWLIINEVYHWMQDNNGLGPGETELYSRMEEKMTSKGMDPFIAQKLTAKIEALGLFQEVNLKKVAAPVSKRNDSSYDESLRRLGKMVAARQRGLLSALVPSLGAAKELIWTCEEELDDPRRDMFFEFYFTWSKRKDI